jgi:hypothetical protein
MQANNEPHISLVPPEGLKVGPSVREPRKNPARSRTTQFGVPNGTDNRQSHRPSAELPTLKISEYRGRQARRRI